MKIKFLKVIFCITFSLSDCVLRVVGSSINGLGTNSSDADMCLILSAREVLNNLLC